MCLPSINLKSFMISKILNLTYKKLLLITESKWVREYISTEYRLVSINKNEVCEIAFDIVEAGN